MRLRAWPLVCVLLLLLAPPASADEADPPDWSELADDRRRDAITQLRATLDEHGDRMDEATRGEALFRLGDLMWEQARADALQAHEELDDAWDRHHALPPEVRAVTPEPKLNLSSADAWTRGASESWTTLLRELPEHERAPEAHFFVALCLDQLGQHEQGLRQRERFVARWPRHRLTGEALSGIGEYHYERDSPRRALRAYQRAATHTASRTYPLTLYRIGWCWYQLGELDNARDAFVGLLWEAKARRRRGMDDAIPLEDETVRVLARVFAELPDLDDADRTFGELVPGRRRELLELTGTILLEHGDVDAAVGLWRGLIDEAPMEGDGPTLLGRVVSALWGARRYDEAALATAEMATRFGEGSAWASANGARPELRTQADALLERQLRDVALGTHREALGSRSDDLMLLAEDCYERYLGLFPDAEGAYEVRYWYAEALFSLEKYDRAADQYEAVVAADPKGRFVRDAAAGSIYAIEKHLEALGVR